MNELTKFRHTRLHSSSGDRHGVSTWYRRAWWCLFGVFVVLSAAVWHGRVPGFDRSLTAHLVQRRGSALFRLGQAVSLLGSGGVVVVVALSVGVVVWRRFRDPILAAVTPVAAGAAGVLELVCKHIVGRLRPVTAAFTGEAGFGFPSGHTTGFTAMAIAAVGTLLVLGVGADRRRMLWVAAAAASVVVGLARILVGAHYVLDVAAGLALGGVCGLTVLWAATWEIVQRMALVVRRRMV